MSNCGDGAATASDPIVYVPLFPDNATHQDGIDNELDLIDLVGRVDFLICCHRHDGLKDPGVCEMGWCMVLRRARSENSDIAIV